MQPYLFHEEQSSAKRYVFARKIINGVTGLNKNAFFNTPVVSYTAYKISLRKIAGHQRHSSAKTKCMW